MARTYEPIASQTIANSSTSSVIFSSLPSTFTDVRIVVSGGFVTGSPDNILALRLNGDTGNNYSYVTMFAEGSPQSAYISNYNTALLYRMPINNQGQTIIELMSYSNTNVFKTFLSTADNPTGSIFKMVHLWRNTASVTSVTLYGFSGSNYLAGTTLCLYGIKAA